MKKLLYFVPEFPRLTETFIEREVSKLVQLGNLDIQIVSLSKANGHLSENLEDKVTYVRLDWISCLMALKYVFIHFKKLISLYRMFLKDSTRNIIKKKYLFLKSLGYVYVFEKYSPEHIHVHFLSESSTMALMISSLLDVPLSISAHAKDIFVDGALISEKAKHAKFIAICNEHAWKEVVRQANKTKSSHKVKLMFHGIDPEYIQRIPSYKLDFEVPLIFSVGRLVEKKGHKYLIEASKILKERGVAHKILIAGSGPLQDELVGLITDFSVGNNVVLLGDTSNADVISYMKASTLFALANIQTPEGDVDGVPTTVIEAAYCACPIVVTRAGSTTDLIRDGQTGMLVAEHNAYELADAIQKLLFDDSLRSMLGNNAAEAAKGMFNLDKNVKDLEKLFLE